MTIEQLAKALGNAIKADERLVTLNKAREAFEKNEELSKLSIELEVQQKALTNEYAKPERDETMISLITKRGQEIYDIIVAAPEYVAMAEAEDAVNKLMNEVNTIITTEITGEVPCTHDCSTCGGHCHG